MHTPVRIALSALDSYLSAARSMYSRITQTAWTRRPPKKRLAVPLPPRQVPLSVGVESGIVSQAFPSNVSSRCIVATIVRLGMGIVRCGGHGLARPAYPLYGLEPAARASSRRMMMGNVAKNCCRGFLNAWHPANTTYHPPTTP